MNVIEAILSRNAQGKLGLPLPDAGQLQQAFACALRAPDHQVLRPWRFLQISGEGLQHLGEVFVQASLADEPDLAAEKIDKLKKMPLRAPLIVVAITAFKDDPKVPAHEQLLSTGAAVQNFMLALHAMGFSCMWRTGPLAENARVKAALAVAGHERIAGFVYVGSPVSEAKKITPLAVADFVSAWPVAQEK